MKAAWWNRVALRVRAAPRCALFLDFDGTLADLTDKPDEARLPPATRRVLRTLVQRPRARVFFISGRRRARTGSGSPRRHRKGAVVSRLLQGPALRCAVPIYVGDDLSDEAAFRAARHGVTIRVGQTRPTAARYQLADASDVRELLALLAQALR
jgi:trehalose-6-phosphatase